MDTISKNLKNSLDKEFSNLLGQFPESGGDVIMNYQNIKKELPEMKKTFKKSEITDLIGKKSMDLPIGKLYSIGKTPKNENNKSSDVMTKKDMMEKWSQKYKDSIDCNNPKGFSQKAHCQGKKKKETKEATASGAAGGGFIGKVAFDRNSEFVKRSFAETPSKGEFKEGVSSASSGSYVTPAAWAKSTSKKDWRGKSKTQIPGGQFVQVKKKCKKFPYCNQGDIKSLNFTNESKLNKIISELSQKYNISKNTIKNMVIKEYVNHTK